MLTYFTYCSLGFGWLKWFNAELSLRGTGGDRALKKWGKSDSIPNAVLSPQERFGITMGSEEVNFNVSLDVKEKVIKTVSINHNF